MAKPSMKPSPQQSGAPQTLEIAVNQWISFFTDFTRQNRGAHARLDVIGTDVGYQVETDDRPFDGVSTDVKDGEHSVWITFGDTPESHLTHGIHNVTAIRLRPPMNQLGAALEVVARDGTRTVLELTLPEAYALPPASQQAAVR